MAGYSWSPSDGSCIAIKYTPAGDTVWTARYEGPARGDGWAEAVTLDRAGNCYIAGSAQGTGTGYDYLTAKFNSQGSLQWAGSYAPWHYDTSDYATALAVDSAGSAYVTGYALDSVRGAVCVSIKYDPLGNREWLTCLPSRSCACGEDLVLDRAGNVYVGLYCDYEYRLVKYVQGSEVREGTPRAARLLQFQVAPNPSSSAVNLRYALAEAGPVDLRIVDVTGREVRRFAVGPKPPGEYCIKWNGAAAGGERVAPGVYFGRLTAGSTTLTRKLLRQE